MRAAIDIETIPIDIDGNQNPSSSGDQKESKPAALDALTGRIVCAGTILVRDEYTATSGIAIVSNNEKKLLEQLWQFLRETKVASFITHNGLGFDFPFLWRRSVIQSVKRSINFDLRKYRKDFIFDTMAVWANWDSRSYPSLDALAQSLGLGAKNGTGSQVVDLWKSGRFVDLGQYCLHDCWLTYACYCRMNFRDPTPESKVPADVRIAG